MLYAKVWQSAIDLRESMVYPDCYDIFNCWEGLRLRKKGITNIAIGLKIVAGLGEMCLLTDRYGFCVTHYVEVENKVVYDDFPIGLKLINRTNEDILVPYGEILCQIMIMNVDMVGR